MHTYGRTRDPLRTAAPRCSKSSRPLPIARKRRQHTRGHSGVHRRFRRTTCRRRLPESSSLQILKASIPDEPIEVSSGDAHETDAEDRAAEAALVLLRRILCADPSADFNDVYNRWEKITAVGDTPARSPLVAVHPKILSSRRRQRASRHRTRASRHFRCRSKSASKRPLRRSSRAFRVMKRPTPEGRIEVVNGDAHETDAEDRAAEAALGLLRRIFGADASADFNDVFNQWEKAESSTREASLSVEESAQTAANPVSDCDPLEFYDVGFRVHFDDSPVIHEVVPYSEIYGLHPRDFVFDRRFFMIPTVLGGFSHGFVGIGSLVLEIEDDSDDEFTF